MEITKESVNKAINEHGFRTRKNLAKYFGVSRKNRKLIKILNEQNLLIRENNPLATKDYATKEMLKVGEYLGKAPSVLEFDDVADKLNLKLRSDMIRKGIFKEKWSVIINLVFGEGTVQERKVGLTNEELLEYIRKFVRENDRLPVYDDFNKNPVYPCYDVFKERFGNFTNAIGLAGVNDTYEKLPFGTKISYKGYVFKSHKEFQIGRILVDNNIGFKQEPLYGIGNLKFDFYIPTIDTYIEYYGLYNKTEDYTKHTEYKRTLYKNRKVLEIFPTDNIEEIMSKVVASSTTIRKE